MITKTEGRGPEIGFSEEGCDKGGKKSRVDQFRKITLRNQKENLVFRRSRLGGGNSKSSLVPSDEKKEGKRTVGGLWGKRTGVLCKQQGEGKATQAEERGRTLAGLKGKGDASCHRRIHKEGED